MNALLRLLWLLAAAVAVTDAKNACKPNPCFPGVKCKNKKPTFECEDCPTGMVGDGFNCTSDFGQLDIIMQIRGVGRVRNSGASEVISDLCEWSQFSHCIDRLQFQSLEKFNPSKQQYTLSLGVLAVSLVGGVVYSPSNEYVVSWFANHTTNPSPAVVQALPNSSYVRAIVFGDGSSYLFVEPGIDYNTTITAKPTENEGTSDEGILSSTTVLGGGAVALLIITGLATYKYVKDMKAKTQEQRLEYAQRAHEDFTQTYHQGRGHQSRSNSVSSVDAYARALRAQEAVDAELRGVPPSSSNYYAPGGTTTYPEASPLASELSILCAGDEVARRKLEMHCVTSLDDVAELSSADIDSIPLLPLDLEIALKCLCLDAAPTLDDLCLRHQYTLSELRAYDVTTIEELLELHPDDIATMELRDPRATVLLKLFISAPKLAEAGNEGTQAPRNKDVGSKEHIADLQLNKKGQNHSKTLKHSKRNRNT